MKTLNTMKRTAIAGIASATLGMSLAAPAQADMFAYSKLLVENFTILGSDGEALDATPEEDFSFLSYTSTGDMDGSLTGTAGFNNTDNISDAGDIDFASDCLTTTGDCNPLLGENTFPFITGPQGTDYVAADQFQSGSPIDGLLNDPTGATIGAVTAASLATTTAAGSANANNGLQAGFVFRLDQDQGITFEGDITLYLEAFASADEVAPSSASAATEFLITITDVTQGEPNEIVFDSRDVDGGLLSQTTAANAGVLPFDLQTCGSLTCGAEVSTGFSFTTVELMAGRTYQLSARTNVNVDINRVQEVPEPGIIALMGAGLLGMFAAGRRRRRA